jgi:hypothetical protein
MLDKLKELWAAWKVQITVVGGVLVIVTAYGQCTYELPSLEAPEVEESATEVTNTTATETTNTTANDAETTTPEATEATGNTTNNTGGE